MKNNIYFYNTFNILLVLITLALIIAFAKKNIINCKYFILIVKVYIYIYINIKAYVYFLENQCAALRIILIIKKSYMCT